MRQKAFVGLFVALFSLNGCGQDYSGSPPVGSEQVTVTVKVPKQLKAETMQVMYRSAACKSKTHGASGKRIEVDGRHGFDVELQRLGQSDLYQAKLPVDGGGACRWRLSNVMFGVAYDEPTTFGENVTSGGGGGVLVKFDRNRPMRSTGIPIEIIGNLTIKKDYYPWVKENFIGGYRKRISLAGEGDIYLGYQALQARQVYFEPVLHSEFVVYSAGPEVKKEGNNTTITYPDGSVELDGRWGPNFRKLQAIRQAAENQQ
ncbi:hypothetical protein B0D71_05815 [Pseudomonas laurylsulfativorans]|uniref:Lipoprotein n=1 Tax=Pseudomonas laurylsulfativorans TaxID=1943631 RepID=A0A2S3VWH8_9PSED|nr:hypothetical protein [Pseudomonas laurylsulfativorans]POF44300.1 hypothetical protein B0D71_05815 [Pseudomonas laurylsulfativorans]